MLVEIELMHVNGLVFTLYNGPGISGGLLVRLKDDVEYEARRDAPGCYEMNLSKAR